MQRVQLAILSVLTVAVIVAAVVLLVGERRSHERLEQLVCIERAQATAAIAVMVPAERVDVEGRVDAARSLGAQVDAC